MRNKKFLFLFYIVCIMLKVSLCEAVIPNGWNLPPIVLSDYLTGYTMLADSLSMAMDEQGNAIAVWKAKFDSDVYVLAARFESATNAWSSTIKAYAGTNVSGALFLRMTKTGDAFIMWQDQQVPGYVIKCTKYTQGTPWANWFFPLVLLNVDSCSSLYECAINELGDALFVYSTESTYQSAFYDHTIDWHYWSPAAVTTPINFSASSLNVSLDNNGQGLVVYNVFSNVYATHYLSSTWSTTTQINNVGTEATQVNLSLEPSSGKNYIMWVEDANSMHATQFGQTSKTLDTLGALSVGKVEEIVDAAGNVTFMWTANDSAAGSIKTTYFNNATWNSWSPVINIIATSASKPITHWTMAVQPAYPYEVFALWELNNGTQYLVQANEGVSGIWVTAVTQNVFALGNNRAVETQLGIDASGNATALWGQAMDQTSVTKIIINAIWYDATKMLWQERSTVLSNSCYCNCA